MGVLKITRFFRSQDARRGPLVIFVWDGSSLAMGIQSDGELSNGKGLRTLDLFKMILLLPTMGKPSSNQQFGMIFWKTCSKHLHSKSKEPGGI